MVTLETVKLIQGMLITDDERTFSKSGDCQTLVQSSYLIEELGQISQLFTDKTGTLTNNTMTFKKLVVNGCGYGLDQPEDG